MDECTAMGSILFSHLIVEKKVVMGEEASAFFVTRGNGCTYKWSSEKEKEGVVVIMMDRENVEMIEGVEYELSRERT